MKIICQLVGMALFGFSPLLFATSPYQHNNGWHGILGIGVIARTEPYKDIDYTLLPLPYLIMRRSHFFIEGFKMGYRAIEGSNGSFDLVLTPRLQGFNSGDSSYFQGMEDRDFSLDGGIATKWRQGMLEFNIMALTDLLDKSDGQEVRASLGNTYILASRTVTLTPSLGLKWQSEDLVDYYYGVSPIETTTNRPTYIGKATLNYNVAINATYLLSKRSTLFAGVEYEQLGEEISDSPLLDEDQFINVFLGYGWQF